MSRSARPLAATALAVAIILSCLATPFLACAAPPQPDAGPEPLAPLVPLTPLEPLAPLVPLEPLRPTDKIWMYLEVGPEKPEVCYPDDVNLVIWVRMTPPGVSLEESTDKGYTEGVEGALVTVKDNGKVVLQKRTNKGGFVDWNWAPKKGKHTLVFTAAPPSPKYDPPPPVTRVIDVRACKKKVTVGYRESCVIPNNAISNEFSIQIEGVVQADDEGKIAKSPLAASYDFQASSNVPDCVYTYAGLTGSFSLEAGGEVTEDAINLDVSGTLNLGPHTGTATCQGQTKSFTFPGKTLDVVNLLKLAKLSFPADGGSKSYSLGKMILLVGTGTAYADVTVSVQDDDESAGS